MILQSQSSKTFCLNYKPTWLTLRMSTRKTTPVTVFCPLAGFVQKHVRKICMQYIMLSFMVRGMAFFWRKICGIFVFVSLTKILGASFWGFYKYLQSMFWAYLGKFRFSLHIGLYFRVFITRAGQFSGTKHLWKFLRGVIIQFKATQNMVL